MMLGRFTVSLNGAVSTPRRVKGVLGVGYQNDKGKNCDETGLIAVNPVLVSTGRV